MLEDELRMLHHQLNLVVVLRDRLPEWLRPLFRKALAEQLRRGLI